MPASPRSRKSLGWKSIIGSPSKPSKFNYESLYHIKIKDNLLGKHDEIKIQFLHDNSVPTLVRRATSFYLSCHNHVRDIPFEAGTMVPAGMRFDPRTSCPIKYSSSTTKMNSQKKNIMSERDLHLALLQFNELFRQSSLLSKSMDFSMNYLKCVRNTLDVKLNNTIHELLPTYMCSASLHNSVHIDANDSTSSFAIFFQEKHLKGLSYLVFPEIGLAIELKSPVLICWNGNTSKHCSISLREGILSLFGSSKNLVDERVKLESQFQSTRKKLKCHDLCVGDSVFVQEKLSDHSDLDSYLKLFDKHKHSTKKATVVSFVDDSTLRVYYKSKKEHGIVAIANVCKTSDIHLF